MFHVKLLNSSTCFMIIRGLMVRSRQPVTRGFTTFYPWKCPGTAVKPITQDPWSRTRSMYSQLQLLTLHTYNQRWWPLLVLSRKINKLVVRTCFMIWMSIIVAFLQKTLIFRIIEWSVDGAFMQLLRAKLGWQHKSPWWYSDPKTAIDCGYMVGPDRLILD